MQPDGAFDQHDERVQVAFASDIGNALIAILNNAGIGVLTVDRESLLAAPSLGSLSGDPLIVELTADELGQYSGHVSTVLAALVGRAPIVIAVDMGDVDALVPLLHLPAASFLTLPCTGAEMVATIGRARRQPGISDGNIGQSEIVLLRDEVTQIAQRLASLADGISTPRVASAPRSPRDRAVFLRQTIDARQLRAKYFAGELFADPAWDILLDLALCRCEARRVSISSLCIAASVPTTTALRWIKAMMGAGLLERAPDPDDGRRSYVALSEPAFEAMTDFVDTVINQSPAGGYVV